MHMHQTDHRYKSYVNRFAHMCVYAKPMLTLVVWWPSGETVRIVQGDAVSIVPASLLKMAHGMRADQWHRRPTETSSTPRPDDSCDR